MPRGHEVIIKATSLGLKESDALPMDPATLEPGMQLFDIIAARDTQLDAGSAAEHGASESQERRRPADDSCTRPGRQIAASSTRRLLPAEVDS